MRIFQTGYSVASEVSQSTSRQPRLSSLSFLSCFTIADVVLLAQPFAAGVKDTLHLPTVIKFCSNFSLKRLNKKMLNHAEILTLETLYQKQVSI